MARLAITGLAAAARWISTLFSAETVASTATAGTIVGVVSSLPGDTVKDAIERKEKAQTRALEAAESRSRVRARTRTRKCKCPPCSGYEKFVNHPMSEVSAMYQAYVTGNPPGVEWFFEGTDFDGFIESACLLQEAKADYDFFFDKKTGNPKVFFCLVKAKNH